MKNNEIKKIYIKKKQININNNKKKNIIKRRNRGETTLIFSLTDTNFKERR
jgi:hypothetical protein